MPEGVSARAPRIPLPPVFSGQTKGWRRWRHQMEAYCNATGMKQAMMMSEHASSDQHFKLYATLTALLPEELLDVIRRHLNDNATSGGQAWAALRTRFEGGHLGRISDMYAVLQSGQQRTETAEAYYHRLDNAFLDLVAEAEEHEDVEAPSHNQVVTQFLAGLRPEYEPIIGILQVTAEHEGRAITWEGDCLKLVQNYSKRIEKNHASEPSAEGYIASGGTKRSAHLATGDGSGPRRLGAPLRGGCWQCGGPHFKRDCPQRPRGNRRQAAADPAPAAFVADEEEEHVAFMAENAGNTPPAKRVALSLLDDEWDDWAPEPGTLLYDLFGGEYESEEDVRPAEAAGAVAQANEREHDLDSHNMDEIISLSGLSDCFGMSDDEAGSASGGMGGSARVVTKSDSAYLLDAVALASVVVDARGACMLGLNDDLGSYPDMWVKDSGAYPHMVADSDSFVEYEQLAPPVEKFGADIWGPVGVTSIGGFRYVFGMTDYYSAYGWVVFMKSKDEAPRALLLVNGLQERMWLTLSEMTVAMLLHAGLGREFWALAFCAAMHIRNNVYSRGVGSVPYRRHTGKTPDVAGLRVFGCPAYVHVDAGNRRKLDAKAFRGVFVGYGQESHTYLALLDSSGVGSKSDASRVQEITKAPRRVVDETDDVDEELEIEEEPLTAEELELGPQQPTLELTQLETNEGTDDGGQEEPIVQRAERDPYPARSRRAPGQWWVVHPENPNDDAAAMMAAAFAAVTQGVDEPITLKQALSGPFKEQWAQAVESEFNSLEKQRTWVGGQLICILVVYVDDMIFAFKDAVWAADFKTALGARFDIKDLGVCAWALGMAVERDWDNATLKVHQAKYIDDMLHKFNLADAYAVSTPAEVGADVPGSNKPLAAEMPYQALVGSLLYAMVATRPDIAEAVSKLCRVMAKPEERHWQAAKRVLRYLKGTKTLGLTFSGGKADGLLHGYCDADWAGDVVSRRSTTGFVFMLCGAAVSWKSQLQATVALSTAEAEYMALCAAVCEALFLRELLRELCCAQSEATVIFEDNQSCIALTRNPMTHGRSKHIAIKYHFTREKVLSGEVAIEYCPTAQMVADALTKALGRLKHAEFAMQMLGA
eukprot:jgi/Tetstr1/426460/TSEL_016761.t1